MLHKLPNNLSNNLAQIKLLFNVYFFNVIADICNITTDL